MLNLGVLLIYEGIIVTFTYVTSLCVGMFIVYMQICKLYRL